MSNLEPIDIEDDDIELYCQPEDVVTFFEKFNNFTETTSPTRRQVRLLIAEKSDEIDRETGHAWRERRVVNEMKDLDTGYRWRSGMPIQLMHRNIRNLDPDKGDKLEFYAGNGYTDWLSDPGKTEGRDENYWIDNETGTLYVYRLGRQWAAYRELRVTYRFGKKKVPAQIRGICAKLVAADLMRSQQYRITIPGNEETTDVSSVAERWEEQAEKKLKRYKEIRSLGINS